MPDDAELLRRYDDEKSEVAFAALVQRHLGLVYSAALRQVGGDAHHAQDVAQAVFTTLARNAASVAIHPVLVGWLYTTTQHVAAKVRRAEGRRHAREHEAHLMHELMSPDSPAVDWEQLRLVLDDAMRELDDRDREAVRLRFFAQRPFAEIGTALRLSEDAARMRVERALDKLHALLTKRGVTSTSAALAVVLTNQAVALAPANLAAAVTAGAFAGVAAGGGATLAGGVMTFMNTTKLAVGVAAVAAAIGVGSAIYEANRAARSAAELAALRTANSGVTAKAAELETQLKAAEVSREAATARIAALENDLALAKKSATGAAPRPAASAMSPSSSPWGNPAYARVYMERFRTSLALRYGLLYRTLNLSPDQIAKFEAALVEGQQGAIDVWAAASSQGLPTSGNSPSATSVTRLTTAPAAIQHDTVKALLGEDGYEKFQQFDKARPARDFIASLAGNLYYSASPLTAQQGDALSSILGASTKPVKIPLPSDGKTPMWRNSDATNWDAVNAQAQTLLAPAQLAALRILTEQTRLDREIAQILNPPAKPLEKQPGS